MTKFAVNNANSQRVNYVITFVIPGLNLEN